MISWWIANLNRFLLRWIANILYYFYYLSLIVMNVLRHVLKSIFFYWYNIKVFIVCFLLVDHCQYAPSAVARLLIFNGMCWIVKWIASQCQTPTDKWIASSSILTVCRISLLLGKENWEMKFVYVCSEFMYNNSAIVFENIEVNKIVKSG